jgi:hypothetical protein
MPESDSYMLFHGVDTGKAGIHLWVNQRDGYYAKLQEEIKRNAEITKECGREVNADQNWGVVKPEDICEEVRMCLAKVFRPTGPGTSSVA